MSILKICDFKILIGYVENAMKSFAKMTESIYKVSG